MQLGHFADTQLVDTRVGVITGFDHKGRMTAAAAKTNREALRQLLLDLRKSELYNASTGFGVPEGAVDEPEGTIQVVFSATLAGLLIKTLENILGERVQVDEHDIRRAATQGAVQESPMGGGDQREAQE